MKNLNWFGKGRKHCGKRRKCWLPAFSPFPTMFSKALNSKLGLCGKELIQNCRYNHYAVLFTNDNNQSTIPQTITPPFSPRLFRKFWYPFPGHSYPEKSHA